MLASNFESLQNRPAKSLQDRRIAYLEHQIQQLKDFSKRAHGSKVNTIQGLILQYESMMESIQNRLDTRSIK